MNFRCQDLQTWIGFEASLLRNLTLFGFEIFLFFSFLPVFYNIQHGLYLKFYQCNNKPSFTLKDFDV